MALYEVQELLPCLPAHDTSHMALQHATLHIILWEVGQ